MSLVRNTQDFRMESNFHWINSSQRVHTAPGVAT